MLNQILSNLARSVILEKLVKEKVNRWFEGRTCSDH